MNLLYGTNIDFMGKKWLWIGISATAVLISLGILATRGVKQGVEFAGGAEVILRFVETPQLDAVRSRLEAAGVEGSSVTTFGDTGSKELVIRAGLPAAKEGRKVDLTQAITDALLPAADRDRLAAGQVNLNTVDSATIGQLLVAQAGLDQAQADAAAGALLLFRRDHEGVFESAAQARSVAGLPAAAQQWLDRGAFLGPFGIRGQEMIEATVGREMRDKALYAALGALAGMLLYLWIRFQFQWGLGAVVALFHDTIVTLGLFSLVGYEANLPVVAAFLTLIGYSVNDTIVVFDRIRENIRNRGSAHFSDVINEAINQTLSRTIITSVLTFLSAAALFFFGGPVLRPFSFVMMFGIIVGTYSSIFIASPLLVVWQKLFPKKGEARREKVRDPRKAPVRASGA